MLLGTNFLSSEPSETVKETPETTTETTDEVVETKEETTAEQEETTDTTETQETAEETTETTEEAQVKDVVANDEPRAISESDILEYLKTNKGFEGEGIDTLFQKQEAPADPFEGLSDEVKQFLKFNKETNGRGIEDWVSLNKDYTQVSPLELAREKAIKESDGALTKADVDEYLEKKLGISLEDTNKIEKFDLIDLKNYGKDYLQSKIAEQQKYKAPLEQEVQKVQLPNGEKVTQQEYQQLVDNQKKEYIKTIKQSSDNIKDVGFEIPFDFNGDKKTINVTYDYSQEDKHKMVSDASDIDAFFLKNFQNKDGSIKAKELQEAMWRMNLENFNKVVIDAAQKMTGEVMEMNLSKENNFKFPTDRITPNKNGQKTVPVANGFTPTLNKKFL